MGVRRVVLGSLALIAVALSCRDPVSSPLTDVQFKAELGKVEFFEGEPVHVAFSLSNEGADTAWVSPFSFSAWYLDGELTDSTGTELSKWGLIIDYLFPPDYRGEPVLSGESLYEIPLIQDRWGVYREDMRNLYTSHHLPAGQYTLRMHFFTSVSERRSSGLLDLDILTGRVSRVFDAEPVTFRVRARTPAEEQSFQALQSLVAMPWDTARRPLFLDSLMAAVRSRPPDDPLATLLAVFVGTASVFGQLPDSAQIDEVVLAAEAVARAQRATAGGASAVLTVNYYRPARMPTLVEELTGSLAGEVAANVWNRRVRGLLTRQ